MIERGSIWEDEFGDIYQCIGYKGNEISFVGIQNIKKWKDGGKYLDGWTETFSPYDIESGVLKPVPKKLAEAYKKEALKHMLKSMVQDTE